MKQKKAHITCICNYILKNLQISIIQKTETVKNFVKKVHDETWSQFILSIKHDVNRRQLVTYQMLTDMNKYENYVLNLNIITDIYIILKFYDILMI